MDKIKSLVKSFIWWKAIHCTESNATYSTYNSESFPCFLIDWLQTKCFRRSSSLTVSDSLLRLSYVRFVNFFTWSSMISLISYRVNCLSYSFLPVLNLYGRVWYLYGKLHIFPINCFHMCVIIDKLHFTPRTCHFEAQIWPVFP